MSRLKHRALPPSFRGFFAEKFAFAAESWYIYLFMS